MVELIIDPGKDRTPKWIRDLIKLPFFYTTMDFTTLDFTSDKWIVSKVLITIIILKMIKFKKI